MNWLSVWTILNVHRNNFSVGCLTSSKSVLDFVHFIPFKFTRHHFTFTQSIYIKIKIWFTTKAHILKRVHRISTTLIVSTLTPEPVAKAPPFVTRLRFQLLPEQMDWKDGRWGRDANLCGFTYLSPYLYLYFLPFSHKHFYRHKLSKICSSFPAGEIFDMKLLYMYNSYSANQRMTSKLLKPVQWTTICLAEMRFLLKTELSTWHFRYIYFFKSFKWLFDPSQTQSLDDSFKWLKVTSLFCSYPLITHLHTDQYRNSALLRCTERDLNLGHWNLLVTV